MTKLLFSFIIYTLAICLFAPLCCLFGGLAGMFVQYFFGESILNILSQLGIKNITMFQFGAFLGFIGMFLRQNTTFNKKD